MKTTNEAIETARQFDKLFAQVKRESSKRHPDHDKIEQLKRHAVKTSKQLRRLMGW